MRLYKHFTFSCHNESSILGWLKNWSYFSWLFCRLSSSSYSCTFCNGCEFFHYLSFPSYWFIYFQKGNALGEFLKDGLLGKSIPFTGKAYIDEYNYHLSKVTELSTSKTHGELFRSVLETWATIGWFSCDVTFLSNPLWFLHSSEHRMGRGTVQKLKTELKLRNLKAYAEHVKWVSFEHFHLSMTFIFLSPTFTGVFSSAVDYSSTVWILLSESAALMVARVLFWRRHLSPDLSLIVVSTAVYTR